MCQKNHNILSKIYPNFVPNPLKSTKIRPKIVTNHSKYVLTQSKYGKINEKLENLLNIKNPQFSISVS